MALYGTRRDHGYAWVVLVSSLLLLFIGSLLSTGVAGMMFILMVRHFKTEPKASVAMIGAVQSVAGGFAGLGWVSTVKNHGSKAVVVAGAIVSTAGYFLSIFIDDVFGLAITYGVTVGIGAAAIQIGAFAALQEYFKKKKAIIFGIVLTVSNIGLMSGPHVVVGLNKAYTPRNVFLMLAGIQLQCVWLGLLLRPFMDQEASVDRVIRRDYLRYQSVVSKEPGIMVYLRPFRHRTYRLYVLAVYLMFCGQFFPFLFMPMRAVTLGFSETMAGLFITLMAAASGIAQLILSYLSEKLPEKQHIICSYFAAAAGVTTFFSYFFPALGTLLFYSLLFGCLIGVVGVMYVVLPIDLWGPQVIEPFTGHIYVCSGLAILTIAPISGGLMDHVNNMWVPGLIFGIFHVLSGLLFYLSSRKTLRKRMLQHSSE